MHDMRDDCNAMFQLLDRLVNNHYVELKSKQNVLLWAVSIIGVAHLVVLGLIVAILVAI